MIRCGIYILSRPRLAFYRKRFSLKHHTSRNTSEQKRTRMNTREQKWTRMKCSFVFIRVWLVLTGVHLCSTCVHLCSLVFRLVWCFRLDGGFARNRDFVITDVITIVLNRLHSVGLMFWKFFFYGIYTYEKYYFQAARYFTHNLQSTAWRTMGVVYTDQGYVVTFSNRVNYQLYPH